jgi:hypothetical protein
MQNTLFEIEPNEPKPRSKPRKLMHVIDAGPGYDKGHDMAQFECNRCGHRSEWEQHKFADIKRGIPCPVCNPPIR